MHTRRSYMVVLRGVGVLLVLLLGSILALVQPASAAPALDHHRSPISTVSHAPAHPPRRADPPAD